MEHRKVQVVVIAKEEGENYLLLLQTNEERGSFWQNITGSVEGNESFVSAAEREFIEETQIKTFDSLQELPYQMEFEDRFQRQVTEKSFLICVSQKYQIQIDPLEHQNYRWEKIEQVNAAHFKYKSNYECFKVATTTYL